jgi:hypothetical protein
MTDPSQDTPPSLVERLRKTASYLAAGCVIPAKPHDGSDDSSDPVDDVTFEVEELRDLASLYATAADALEEKLGEVARLADELSAQADPPNRAHLLAQLEELTGPEMLSACGRETVDTIHDTIAALRTDARVIEASREKLKVWHSWARKLARAEGDEYANAMPATLQTQLAGQVEAGQLALLVAPIHRRVELTLALCADMGLGGPEAAELAPKAALWTDAEVAEIEAFRTRDWSGTKVNPFDHLPPALERTIYPGPGGRRAYFKRAGDPLPEPTAAAKDRQLGLPGLPKPETALRLRLALIDKPDGPLSGLVAGFAQALLEKLDKAGLDRENAHAWMEDGWAATLRKALREHVEKGDPRDVAAYSAFAWHHGWSLASEATPFDRLADLARVLGLRAHMNERQQVIIESPAVYFEPAKDTRDHHADLRHAMGHTTRTPSAAEVEQTHADLQRWTSWARELAGCTDGTDEELRGFVGRLVARMHAMRTRNLTAFDHGTGKPWAPAWDVDAMGRVVFYADGRDATVDRLMLRIDADGFGLWVGDRLGVLVEIWTIEEVARLYPLVAPTLADYKADRLVPFAVLHDAASMHAAAALARR